MNNRPPLVESLAAPVLTPGWANWFTQVFAGLPWNVGSNTVATLDFASIAAQSQAGLAVTIARARAGDAVQITPTVDVPGVVFTGVVTAPNTVTVYAKNFTAGAIDPAAQVYRIILLQK